MEIEERDEQNATEPFNEHNCYYFLPDHVVESERMDIPNVGNSEFFRFVEVRKHEHPTNPATNGFISSRILPDGSNTFRFTTALGADIPIPDQPDWSAFNRMNSEEYKTDYAFRNEKPKILTSGAIDLFWKE